VPGYGDIKTIKRQMKSEYKASKANLYAQYMSARAEAKDCSSRREARCQYKTAKRDLKLETWAVALQMKKEMRAAWRQGRSGCCGAKRC
jgi:hypothetical protein